MATLWATHECVGAIDWTPLSVLTCRAWASIDTPCACVTVQVSVSLYPHHPPLPPLGKHHEHRHGDRLRVCTWDAILDGQRWSTNCYCAGVEDPFNSDDNAARTMSDVRKVVNAFQSSRHAYYAASISGAHTHVVCCVALIVAAYICGIVCISACLLLHQTLLGMESAAMFRLFGPAAVEDPELAALSAQLQDDIMAIKVLQ